MPNKFVNIYLTATSVIGSYTIGKALGEKTDNIISRSYESINGGLTRAYTRANDPHFDKPRLVDYIFGRPKLKIDLLFDVFARTTIGKRMYLALDREKSCYFDDGEYNSYKSPLVKQLEKEITAPGTPGKSPAVQVISAAQDGITKEKTPDKERGNDRAPS